MKFGIADIMPVSTSTGALVGAFAVLDSSKQGVFYQQYTPSNINKNFADRKQHRPEVNMLLNSKIRPSAHKSH